MTAKQLAAANGRVSTWKHFHICRLRQLALAGLTVFLVIAGSVAQLCLPVESAETMISDEPDSAQQKNVNRRESARPSENVEEIFQRFVEECVAIRPGTEPFPPRFRFGSTTKELHGIVPREVSMSQHFRISQYEVTQELYEAVMNVNPSRWKGPRNSVENVSFRNATDFCERLTVLLRARRLIASREFVRLPSELEWEYCCRAGTTTRYSFGDQAAADGDISPRATLLDPFAWHTGNAAGNDPAVGVLKPNAWGLYDCHGYLWEFVADVWSDDGQQPTIDGRPNDGNSMRTVRGGSWKDEASRLTSSSRRPVTENFVDDATGFRCVIAEKPQAQTH